MSALPMAQPQTGGRQATVPVSIESLPNELLSSILSYLDSPSPSESRLHDQPSIGIFKPDDGVPPPVPTPLKAASLVSRRWRSAVLPLLFQHVVWPVDRWDLLIVEQEPDHVAAIPLLAFLREHGLGPYVSTFTMVVADSLAGMHRLQAEDELDRSQEAGGRGREGSGSSISGGGAGEGSASASSSRRVSLRTALRMVDDEPGLERSATYNEDNNWLWAAIFGLVDPLRFTVVASPRMLASLLSRMLYLGDAWSFESSLHILSMSRKKRGGTAPENALVSGTEHLQDKGHGEEKEKGKQKEKQKQKEKARDEALPESPTRGHLDTLQISDASRNDTGSAASTSASSSRAQQPARGLKRVPCNLFTIRPWTSLLLNEGSSARVYSTYEFFLKRPPSILGALLGTEEFPNDAALLPATVRSLSYVAVFPLSSHVGTLIRHLPPLDRLFLQLVPRSDIFAEAGAGGSGGSLRQVDPSDLWVERNTAYSMVIRAMMDGHRRGNWRRLREFESGDAADREAWEMAVQYVRLVGRAWRIAGDGVFVRRDDHDDDNDDLDDDGGDGLGDSSGVDDDPEDDDFDDGISVTEIIGGGGDDEDDENGDFDIANSPFLSV